ncbi:MAG: TetR family transcriptional regulator [Actinobacteria bacterium]|nr:TetR family transcriptional regulator [Actinomycetota bacterium]
MTTETTRERILDATIEAISMHGLSRLGVEDVASAAGVSRQTVYRYFGSRDELIRAAIVGEERQLMQRIAAAAQRHTDLRPSVEAAILEALVAAREHPLLDRLLATEPEALLPALLHGSGPVLTAALPVLEDLLSERLPHLSPVLVHRAADATTRLLVSYAVNPTDEPLEQVATELADLLVHGLKAE